VNFNDNTHNQLFYNVELSILNANILHLSQSKHKKNQSY